MAGASFGAGGEQVNRQEEIGSTKGSSLRAARFVAALAGALVFVTAQPRDVPTSAPGPAHPIVIDVPRAKTREVPPVSDEQSMVPGVDRPGVERLAGGSARSVQDHDDVEESDRDRDARESDDGSVGNGDFEGGTVARGHNITTSNSSAPSDERDD